MFFRMFDTVVFAVWGFYSMAKGGCAIEMKTDFIFETYWQ